MGRGLGRGTLGSMPLGGDSTMEFDYESRAAAIISVFTAANTQTSDPFLSEDLSTTVQTIIMDDPEAIGIRWNDLPALFLRVRDSENEFGTMGNESAAGRGRHFKTVRWELFGLYKRDGRAQKSSSLLTLVYDFARNCEAVIMNNPKMGGTALWAIARRTDFGDVLVNGDAIKGFRVDLEARYFYR